MRHPPLTGITVTKEPALDASQTAAPAISSGVPARAKGVSATLLILSLGAGATARLGEINCNVVTGTTVPSGEPWPATIDNELRFYAASWLAYGVDPCCLWNSSLLAPR